jgi:UTP--glucose-1-phosphate uridylyltransferase
VKTTDDLLVVRSGVYDQRDTPPYVELDPEYFGRLADFEARFPHGPPSLRGAERLVVHGDVTFGRDVTVTGDVTIDGPAYIEDGASLDG